MKSFYFFFCLLKSNKIKILQVSYGPKQKLILLFLIEALFWDLRGNRWRARIVGIFGFLPSVNHFISVLPLLSLQPSSFNKVVYPGLQALAAWTLHQRPVIFLPAAFQQPAMVGRNTTCGFESNNLICTTQKPFHFFPVFFFS